MSFIIITPIIAAISLIIAFFSANIAGWFVLLAYAGLSIGFLYKSFSKYNSIKRGAPISKAEMFAIAHVPFTASILLIIIIILLFVDISKFHLLWLSIIISLIFEFTVGRRTLKIVDEEELRLSQKEKTNDKK